MTAYFQCGRYRLDLVSPVSRPLVMGILNVTPDSFSDGGKYMDLPAALRRAEQMIKEGADIIDIGAESTRPGAGSISLQEELDRLMPVVEALRHCERPLSIDTGKPEVMAAALAAGADMINNTDGFRSAGPGDSLVSGECGICVMHMQGSPETMQTAPAYTDVTEETIAFLKERVEVLLAAGISRERICIDPGFGFGKTVEQNLVLLKNLSHIRNSLQLPLLVGLSRKSVIGAITGREVSKRLAGNLGAALSAVANGANILRVHEVGETVDALKVWRAAR